MKWISSSVVGLLALGLVGCTPDWATQSAAQGQLLMTSINSGNVLDSDVAISTGAVCPDFVPIRLENHYKNPHVSSTGFRDDIVIQRYEVHYRRSDGRNVEGVDVPYSISGNVNQEVIAESDATLSLEVVRRQAKLEPPLKNLTAVVGGSIIFTAFADITLVGKTTIDNVTNTVTGSLQIDFADFADTKTTCQ
jgi:hypothetical protein